MRITKTADALSLLSLPQKVTPTMYELMAKEACDAYMQDQTSPNTTIAKLASARGLNHEQIHRVAELANHQINSSMVKGAGDQLFTFPVATVQGVLTEMSGETSRKEASMAKVAEDIDFGVYDRLDRIPDYCDVMARRRFSSKIASLAKEAEAPAKDWDWDQAPAAARQNHQTGQLKVASAGVEYSEMEVRASLAGIRGYWEKLAGADDQIEFLYAGAHVLGMPGMKQLSEAFGADAAKLASGLDAGHLELISSSIDTSHPLLSQFQDLKGKLESYGESKQKLASVEGVIAAGKKFVKNPIRRGAAYGAAGYGLSKATGIGDPNEIAQSGVRLGLTPGWVAPVQAAKGKIMGSIRDLQTGGVGR